MTYADHPEYRALLAAVLAVPADDLPRLVLADWLDEHGEGERAEFIRVQCQVGKVSWDDDQILRQREWELFERHKCEWFGGSSWAIYYLDRDREDADQHADLRAAIVRRGFVAEVRCTLVGWCGGECPTCCRSGITPGRQPWVVNGICPACNGTGRTAGIGPQVVAAHPVERVVLTDREPDTYDAEGGGMWHSFQHSSSCSGPNEIPHFLRQHFPKDCDGRSRESVMAGLSAALIAWAKSQNVTPATYREHHDHLLDHLLGEIARGLGVPAHLLTDSTN